MPIQQQRKAINPILLLTLNRTYTVFLNQSSHFSVRRSTFPTAVASYFKRYVWLREHAMQII